MHIVLVGALLATALFPARAADLTEAETHWLQAAWPVVLSARRDAMPVDIVVQPQASPGASPIALGFVDGRCKLVLSMRGNPQADTLLDHVPAGLGGAAIEMMAAHELGHCRRYLDGAWHRVPAGFNEAVPPGLPADLQAPYAEMKATRREEAYGDLVGLAWTQRHHPHDYAALQGWLIAERSRDRLPGSHHDTLAWLRLVDRGVDDGAAASIYDAAAAVWPRGFVEPD